MPDEANEQMEALGAAIRAQRKLANLSLRQLAGIAEISNPYLSQIERGLHAPSVHVLRSIANALSLSAETLQGQAGAFGEGIWPSAGGQQRDGAAEETEIAVRRDPFLTDEQKAALLAVYRSYKEANLRSGGTGAAGAEHFGDPPRKKPPSGRRGSAPSGGRPGGGRSRSAPPPSGQKGS